MLNEDIKVVVTETLNQLLNGNMIKYGDTIIVDQIGELLKAHYSKPDNNVAQALESLSGDYYYTVLYKYYGEGYTLERLAGELNADVSTIMRNKKRLCIELYKLLN